jgi:hypothetical protein
MIEKTCSVVFIFGIEYSSLLKMEVLGSSDTFKIIYQTIRRYAPE